MVEPDSFGSVTIVSSEATETIVNDTTSSSTGVGNNSKLFPCTFDENNL